MIDWFFVGSLFIGFLIPFLFMNNVGRIYWSSMIVSIGIIIIIAEIIATKINGLTLSEMFWGWSENHKVLGWLSLSLIGYGLGVIFFHLGKALIFGKDKEGE